mgnify:FL=1
MLYSCMTELEKKQSQQIANLTARVDGLAEQNKALNEQVQSMMTLANRQSARIEDLLKQLYGKKSEKKPTISKSGSAREAEKKKKPTKEKKKKSSNNFQMPEGIEEEVIFIDVFDCEKTNPETGQIFPVVDQERRELLSRKVVYKKIVIVRNVYGGGVKYGVIKAEWPKQLLQHSSMDAELKASISVKRTLEYQPFYRLVENFIREGFKTTRQTLNKDYIDLAFSLEPLYRLLHLSILEAKAIYADETFLKQQVKSSANGKLKDCYMWFLCARAKEVTNATIPLLQGGQNSILPDNSLIYIEFADNRRHENAEKIIRDFRGRLHSDCYEAYEKLAENGVIIWQPCWTHARRKFIKAPDTVLSQKILNIMSEIISSDEKNKNLSNECRQKKRTEEIKPLVNKLLKILKEKKDSKQVQLCKKLSEAFNYFLKRENHFLRFLDDPELAVDNNLAERAIRPLKIGAKNWLFIGSDKGGKAAAIMNSLLLTCKNIGVDPQQWLAYVIRNMPYTQEKDLKSLLPQNWLPTNNTKSEYLPANYQG